MQLDICFARSVPCRWGPPIFYKCDCRVLPAVWKITCNFLRLGKSRLKRRSRSRFHWLWGQNLNLLPSRYEPVNHLPERDKRFTRYRWKPSDSNHQYIQRRSITFVDYRLSAIACNFTGIVFTTTAVFRLTPAVLGKELDAFLEVNKIPSPGTCCCQMGIAHYSHSVFINKADSTEQCWSTNFCIAGQFSTEVSSKAYRLYRNAIYLCLLSWERWCINENNSHSHCSSQNIIV